MVSVPKCQRCKKDCIPTTVIDFLHFPKDPDHNRGFYTLCRDCGIAVDDWVAKGVS